MQNSSNENLSNIEKISTETTKYDITNSINEIKKTINNNQKTKKKVVFSEISTIESLFDELNDNKSNIKVENKTIDEMLDELNNNNINVVRPKLKKFDEEGIKNMLQKLNCNIEIKKPNKETELNNTLNNTHVKVGCDYVCIIS